MVLIKVTESIVDIIIFEEKLKQNKLIIDLIEENNELLKLIF